MEFVFNKRSEAKAAPFFFTDEEINNGGTSYGWVIVIKEDLRPAQVAKQLESPDSAGDWDAYCAAISRRFARKDHPHLSYDDLFQEARLKVVELLSDKTFPFASPRYEITDEYRKLDEEELQELSQEERQAYRELQDNVRFRSALKRALIDYSNRVR